jgi:probable addiction module antidote protein
MERPDPFLPFPCSMTQLARDTGMVRESLYKALSGDGNPSFATILKFIHALGLKLHVLTQNNP